MSSSRGLHIIGPMRVLASSSDSILVSLLLCEHCIIYVFLCNSRTHLITLYLDHVCVLLCVNALALASRMDPGLD
jgi:hypothetical protein